MPRPTIHETLMGIAILMADRSTCSFGNVGAVLARDGRVIASGYNGAPSGMPHCDHTCDCGAEARRLSEVHATYHNPACQSLRPCRTAVHAEANAVAFAARNGLATEGTTLYTTVAPCLVCAQLLVNAGVIHVRADRAYRDPAGVELLAAAGVEVDTEKSPL